MEFLRDFLKRLFEKEISIVAKRTLRFDELEIIDEPSEQEDVAIVFVQYDFFANALESELNNDTTSFYADNTIQIMKKNGVYFVSDSCSVETRDYFSYSREALEGYLNRIGNVSIMKYIDAFAALEEVPKEKYDAILKEIEEEASKRVIDTAVTALSAPFIRSVEDIKRSIINLQEGIRMDKLHLLDKSNKLQKILVDAKQFEGDKYSHTIQEQIGNILHHKKVACFIQDPNYLVVKTVPLYMYEPIRKQRFYLGVMLIKIPLTKDYDIKFDNLDNKRNGYWECSPHPHCASDGYACFGNVDAQLAQYQADGEYYGMFLTLLSYLETANIEDCAGASIVAWDMVNEEGNIIEKGHYSEDGEDEDDGNWNEDEEDDENDESSMEPDW